MPPISAHIVVYFFAAYIYRFIVCFSSLDTVGIYGGYKFCKHKKSVDKHNISKILFSVPGFALRMFMIVQICGIFSSNSLYRGLKNKSYKTIKGWFHLEMISVSIQFYVCGVLKESFVLRDSTDGFSTLMRTMVMLSIDLGFIAEASMFCIVIWAIKSFKNDEVQQGQTVPAAGKNAQSDGNTSFLLATHAGNLEKVSGKTNMCGLLLKKGASINITTCDVTAVHCTASQVDPPKYEDIETVV